MDRRSRRDTRRLASFPRSGSWRVTGATRKPKHRRSWWCPDEPDGGWDLSGETGGVLIVCIYGKTNDYYATALPAGIKSCLATGEYNDKTYTLSDGRVTCK